MIQIESYTEPEHVRRYRSLFISDGHLGTKGCQCDLFLDLLRRTDADTIYLVDDIVDDWRLKQGWFWPQEHNDIVQKLLRKVRKHVRMVYIPGDHDEFLKDYLGVHFGGVKVVESAIHVGVDGKRYLIVHGVAFDLVVRMRAGSRYSAIGLTNGLLSSTPTSTRRVGILD